MNAHCFKEMKESEAVFTVGAGASVKELSAVVKKLEVSVSICVILSNAQTLALVVRQFLHAYRTSICHAFRCWLGLITSESSF